MKTNLLGIDIGGTKCAVIYGIDTDGSIEIADKVRFDTTDVQSTIARILEELKGICAKHGLNKGNTKGVQPLYLLLTPGTRCVSGMDPF